MKYNDPIIDDNENEAHNIILKKITPGSTVLEFGAANGRMTRKLKNVLGCKVYIVEIEEAAFRDAIVFAEDGICDDINNLAWKKWGEKTFDFILFADVLEHLQDSYAILQETYELLKDEGSVLVSVPNVGHNDIWGKLFLNHFDYTDIGVLDNTHLHFFAEENLLEFEANSDYRITDIQYKTLPTLTTEQFLDSRVSIPGEIKQFMYSRKNGEVYQFILEMKKKEFFESQFLHKKKDIYPQRAARLYYNRGGGFTQEDGCTVVSTVNSCGESVIDINIMLPEDVSEIRLDPVEEIPCVVKYISTEGCEVIGYSNGLVTKMGTVLYTNDPQILCKVNERKICIRLVFISSYRAISTALYDLETEKEQSSLIREQIREIGDGQIQTRDFLENQYRDIAFEIDSLQEKVKEDRKSFASTRADLEQQMTVINQEIASLRESNENWSRQLLQTVMNNNALTAENLTLIERNDALDKQISEMKALNASLEQRVTEIANENEVLFGENADLEHLVAEVTSENEAFKQKAQHFEDILAQLEKSFWWRWIVKRFF